MRRRLRIGSIVAGVLPLAIVSVLACSGKVTQAGGLEVLIETDMPTPSAFDVTNVKFEQGTASGGWKVLNQRDYLIPSEITLPTTFALKAGPSADQEVRITVTGLAGTPEVPAVQRIVQTQVPTDSVEEVVIVLSSKCLGKVSCPVVGDSCQPEMGACGPSTAPKLVPYDANSLLDAGVATTAPVLDGGMVARGDAGVGTCATPCGPHQTCTAANICECSGSTGCSMSGLACVDASTLASCGQDAQGCWYPASMSTCANGACYGAAGSAACCTNACTAGSTRCGGAGLETCRAQGNGCTAWDAGTACGPNQTCTGVAGSASCTCNTDPNCASAASVCTNTATLAVCAMDAQGCFYTSSSMPCGTNQHCTNGACSCANGFQTCGTTCADTTSDSAHCGSCTHACPVLSAPSVGAKCASSTCTGSLGGATASSAAPVALDGNDGTVYFQQVRTPSVAGTFGGVGAVVGSNDPSGSSTEVILGLFSDSGGSPGVLLFNTSYTDTNLQFNNPAAPFKLESSSGVFNNGFGISLPANTAYWAYLKVGTGSTAAPIAAPSSGNTPCVTGSWINVDPPGMYSYTTPGTCPASLQLYMLETF
jgi:hypothetical protein